MDVSNAFLYGDLYEIVFMKLPQGYTHFGSRIQVNQTLVKTNSSLVCQLHKSLYGLRQAPRQWFSKLSVTLTDLTYIQSKSDASLFLRKSATNITVVLAYVDDLLICGNDNTQINHLKQMLSKMFHMKDLGPAKYFLGLEIDRSASGFFLSQQKYTKDLLEEYGMSQEKPLNLPLDFHLKLTHDKGDPLPQPVIYQRLLGKLIYLTITRPDIAFSVQLISQFMHSPTTVHYQTAKKTFKVLGWNCESGYFVGFIWSRPAHFLL